MLANLLTSIQDITDKGGMKVFEHFYINL